MWSTGTFDRKRVSNVAVRPRLSLAHLLAILIVVSFHIGLSFVQDRFLEQIFPNTPAVLRLPQTRYSAAKVQRTTEFFGLDTSVGPYRVLQQLGRPPRARIFKLPDYAAPPYPDRTRLIEYRVYSYPGMEITFREGLLSLIDITGEQWRFPIGIKIGDPVQAVYDRFGQPGWRYEYDGQVQVDWSFTARLSVYLRNGTVSRIIWG